MTALNGLEKFSHLEDKLFRFVEQYKVVRKQRDELSQELEMVRQEYNSLAEDKVQLQQQIAQLMSERDEIRAKVEGMLDAIAIIDPELAEPAHN